MECPIKVQFEIGHEAYLRSEVTPQGFTHDWQVFVRGAENKEIHHFVEKVVFNLHDSFPKPRRVVKEPPYEVKESGYASFAFPIEVYLKTKDEPRKLDFNYDLQLNTNNPVRSSQREKRVINNPSEEFCRKLMRGGGQVVGGGSDMLPLTDNSQNTDKSSSKKSSTDSTKKHKSKESLKPEEVRPSNQFADLFGTPIKKLSPTTVAKKSAESKHSSDGKVASKSASKHSPHKEREKDKDSAKKELMNNVSKEKDKDREKSREKDKKQDKILKRPPSPTVQPPAKIIKEEPKKSSHDEVKEKEKKSVNDITKNERKEKRKDKKNRDEKDKKDRHKDHESKKEIPPVPPPPRTPPIVEKEKDKPAEKSTDKVKSEYKETKENLKKSPKHLIKEEKVKEKLEKDKVDPIEKQRHKHKKKEKNKKEEKEIKEKDKAMKKVEKQPPAPVHVTKEPTPPPQPPPQRVRPRSPSPKASKNPLSALMNEMSDKGSDSESSGEEDTASVNNDREKGTPPPPPPPPPAPTPPASSTPDRLKEEKLIKEKVKKKEKKGSAKDEDGSRKKKRKNKDQDQIVPEKTLKMKAESEKIMKDEPVNEDEEERFSEPSSVVGSPQRDDISRSPSPPKFTEEYVMELKDLQQKIMTLEDNAELQRVVQVIAETGQYEITKKTFDFDLCALDKSTVRRLQDLFFAAS